MNELSDKITVAILKFISRLPFRALYIIADILYILLYYIIRYRREIVNRNLRLSFPEKNEEEIGKIARQFYHHFADLMVESIKLNTITDQELDKRLQINNLELVEECYQKGQSIILLGMHYNNWEWSASVQRHAKSQLLMIYNPVRRNKAMERFILDMRERFGGLSIPVHLSARTAIEFNNMKKSNVLWLAADQTPPANSRFWTLFLNQETPFFSGPEKIAIKTNQPIFLHHTRKLSRGHYEVNFHKLFDRPADYSADEIMLTYIQRIEEIIREEPAYWLWSHRRWKHKRPGNIELIQRKEPEQA